MLARAGPDGKLSPQSPDLKMFLETRFAALLPVNAVALEIMAVYLGRMVLSLCLITGDEW